MTTATLSAVVSYVRRLGERDTRGLTDRQLLERFTARRDETAFAELVCRHGSMVLSACRRVLRHTQDAEDAFQAAFLVLARKAGSIRQGDSIGGWLHQVAHRLALRARVVAHRRREQHTTVSDAFGPCAPEPPRSVFGPALDEEVRRLPEPYREAVVLCYLEGRTQAEAARLLATTADAVNSRLKRARDLLRQRFTRSGLVFSGAALAEALNAGVARAALTPALVRLTAQAALHFATGQASACGASTLAVSLAQEVLRGTMTALLKVVSALLLVAGLVAAGAWCAPTPAQGDATMPPALTNDPPPAAAQNPPAPRPGGKDKRQPSVIVLWMSGGPSQFETFDPKAKAPNALLFPAIDTALKGMQFSAHLPRLAKLADRLTVLRSVTHREGDHARATYWMRTGYTVGGGIDYPSLGCVLAKELGDNRPEMPRYLGVGTPVGTGGFGPGFLGPQLGPLPVGLAGKARALAPIQFANLQLPPVEAFEALAKGKGAAHRKAVEKAFDMREEKEEVRKAYGPGLFGQGCLLARRLVERGVPVVEVHLGGWDMHGNVAGAMPKLGGELDAGFATLLHDLDDRKLLDSTLVVWMGEFGRTPTVNANGGRDHWPSGFTVVLAGGGVKRGQVVGKTGDDGVKITERPVTVPELLATVYRAVGVDAAKTYALPGGEKVPLVEKGTKPVQEALR